MNTLEMRDILNQRFDDLFDSMPILVEDSRDNQLSEVTTMKWVGGRIFLVIDDPDEDDFERFAIDP